MESGDLPHGVYQLTLSEILECFGAGSPRRQLVGQRLVRIYQVAWATNRLARFVVFGSFVTQKAAPNDVDIFLLMEDDFELDLQPREARLLFDHPSAQMYFGASVFWLRRMAALGGEDAAIEEWQITRGGTRRGIIEIVPEAQ